MRTFSLPILTLAASTLLAAPSLAGAPALVDGPYYIPLRGPDAPSVADVTNPGMIYAQPNGAGVYDCQRDEKRTRLQRRACGPWKNLYGD